MGFSTAARNNPFLSNSFFIFIIRFFPSLANLLVIVYYSRQLDVAQYGTYSNFWINLNLMYPLACLGIHVLFFTYPPAALLKIIKQVKVPQYVGYGLWLAATGSAFAVLQAGALHGILVPFGFVIVYAVTLIFESYLMIGKRFPLLVVVNVLFSALYWGIHKYALGVSFSLPSLFAALFVLMSARLLVYVAATTKSFRSIDETASSLTLDMKQVRNLWLHLALYDIVQNYSGWVDKFIVAHTLDSRASAVYYNGSLNIPFLPLLLSAALSAVLIQLSETNDDDETAQVLRLMDQVGRMLSCIVFPLFFFLLLYRYQVVVLLLSGKYVAAIPVFLVSLFIMPLRAYSFTSILQRKHKGAIINKGAVGEIVLGCALIYPLYQWLGLPGVALAFVISTYLLAAYYLCQTAKVLGVQWYQLVPLANWAIKFSIFAIVFIVLHFITTHYFTDVIGVILGAIATTAVILFALWAEIKNRHTYGTS